MTRRREELSGRCHRAESVGPMTAPADFCKSTPFLLIIYLTVAIQFPTRASSFCLARVSYISVLRTGHAIRSATILRWAITIQSLLVRLPHPREAIMCPPVLHRRTHRPSTPNRRPHAINSHTARSHLRIQGSMQIRSPQPCHHSNRTKRAVWEVS